MFTALLMISLAAVTTEVWTTSTLNPLTGDSRLHATASRAARIHAARGEREGLLVFVRAGRRGLEGVTVQAPAPASGFPPPRSGA